MTTATLERPAKPCGCPKAVLGQKVKIMEGVTNAGAGGQRVHIAEGVGNWALGRSSQTVHIRPVIEECECGITDTFERVEAGPEIWGFADIYNPSSGAGEWVIIDGNVGSTLDWEATVEGTYGRLWSEANDGAHNGADPRARLYGLGISPSFRIRFRVKFVSFDTASESAFADFLVMSDAGTGQSAITVFFGDKLYMGSEGVVGQTDAAFDPTPGTWYHVLWEQDFGDEQRVKIWEGTLDDEPGSWLLTQDVTGQTAWTGANEFRIDLDQIDGGVADALELHFDDLDIEDVEACVYDNFNRASFADWGDTTPGNTTYEYPFGGIPAGVLVYTQDDTGGVDMENFTGVVIRMPAHSFWTNAAGFVMTYDFLTAAIPGAGDYVAIDLFEEFFELDVGMLISSDALEGFVYMQNGPDYTEVGKNDWIADTWYTFKWESRPGGLVRVKVWPRADAEPAAWIISETQSTGALTGYLQLVPDNNSGGDYSLYFDNITFNVCPEEVVG